MLEQTNIPISLYVHIPWCQKKCPYCDFNSHALKTEELPEVNYTNRLIEDFKNQCSFLQGRPIQTIFIGGGTPSLFSPKSYQKLFSALYQYSNITDDVEITIEANPGTIEQSRFAAYQQIGINRLSIGIQSFQNRHLKMLGRIHDAHEAEQAVRAAQQAGFNNINLDLMFGLPKQSLTEGIWDLTTAINLKPTHISWYQLTLEPHTYFYHHPPILPKDTQIEVLQLQGWKILREAGYKQYEVSAYSNPKFQCEHNLNYWQFGDYIGIGAGAHGKITQFDQQQIVRRWNKKHPKDYLNPDKVFLADQCEVSLKERPLEYMMNTLRLYQPVFLEKFEQRTGLNRQILNSSLSAGEQQGFLQYDHNQITLSTQGHQYLNELLALF